MSDEKAPPSRLRNEQEARKQRHFRHLCGLWAGFALAIGMLAGSIIVGVNGQAWLAALLAGPSLTALAKIFVLRRSDPSDVRQLQPLAEPPPALASPRPALVDGETGAQFRSP